MNELQLTLILAWYRFDKSTNVDAFTRRFNQYFERDYSAQTILFSAAKFKNVDPANNILHVNSDKCYRAVWDRYISNDRIHELRELYKEFKKGSFNKRESVFDDVRAQDVKSAQSHDDQPISKCDLNEHTSAVYPRNAQVVFNALNDANYKCELKCGTKLFLRKNSQINYTEAHHLIPLCYQADFEYSLDVEANVVSLCPNCHRHLHYGDDISELLRTLYESRKERLIKCGIEISFAQLLLLYR